MLRASSAAADRPAAEAPPAEAVPTGPSAPATGPAAGFADEQWRLLVRLPAAVMIAAISVPEGTPRRTVPEGLAGLDAIAAGRDSSSELVQAAVAAIYTEPDDDALEVTQPAEPALHRRRVLDDCRRAVEVLRMSAHPADAAAYRHWVQQVAVRVCAAGRSGGVLGLGPERPSEPEQAFLDELAAVLA